MMKKVFLFLAALWLVSCADEQLLTGDANEQPQVTNNSASSVIDSYVEKARWGDGKAYMKLADCYRDGIGVKTDFLSLIGMLSLAEEYDTPGMIETYFNNMPADHEFRMLFDFMNILDKKHPDESRQIAERMMASGMNEGYTAMGVLLVETGDTIGGKRLIQTAADLGSMVAEMILTANMTWRDGSGFDLERLEALSDKTPWADYFLGRLYAGFENEALKDARLAAAHLLKADRHAMLDSRSARWLLNYHHQGGDVQLSEQDVERLHKLIGVPFLEEEKHVSHIDPKLESDIKAIMAGETAFYTWNNACIYVVETKTGRIKADVSLEQKGGRMIPFVDDFEDEQMVMETGSTYLALLSTGKVTPGSVFDTGTGVYKDIKDHNWRRGGYGTITLEEALGFRSQVAFTMAKEKVYGDRLDAFNSEMNGYFCGMEDSPMGLLTFYNAVANNGRMLMPVSEGKDVLEIREQIAPKEHIKALQAGMRKSVTQGLMKKCGRRYVDVAACGRTFIKEGNTYRMEVCGYFPAEDPQYTIMVTMEKDGLPASAGGMCGIIMAKTIDHIITDNLED